MPYQQQRNREGAASSKMVKRRGNNSIKPAFMCDTSAAAIICAIILVVMFFVVITVMPLRANEKAYGLASLGTARSTVARQPFELPASKRDTTLVNTATSKSWPPPETKTRGHLKAAVVPIWDDAEELMAAAAKNRLLLAQQAVMEAEEPKASHHTLLMPTKKEGPVVDFEKDNVTQDEREKKQPKRIIQKNQDFSRENHVR